MYFDKLFKYCPVCGSAAFSIHNHKSKKCQNCQFTMYINPSAAVAAFIFNENNELLVCIRGKEPVKGSLDLPGGFIDEHETAEDALIRELKEELNAETQSIEYKFSLPNEYFYSGWTLPTLDMFFKVKITDNTNIMPSDDVAAYKFMSVRDLNPEEFGLKSIKKAISILKNKFLSE
jgi:ADP-ribose pyrophosphatase YjhB (NUDIX family)